MRWNSSPRHSNAWMIARERSEKNGREKLVAKRDQIQAEGAVSSIVERMDKWAHWTMAIDLMTTRDEELAERDALLSVCVLLGVFGGLIVDKRAATVP